MYMCLWPGDQQCFTMLHQSHPLVPGCGREGGANVLLAVAIGGVVPGVRLNNQGLAAHAQLTPKKIHMYRMIFLHIFQH